MADIGYTTQGNYFTLPSGNGSVLACKFTASSYVSAVTMNVYMTEYWGQPGTVYTAIYSNNSGVPGTMLGNGSTSYVGGYSNWKTVSISTANLTNGVDYWLCVYWYKNSGGTFWVFGYYDYSASKSILTWKENVKGSWTNGPSSSTFLTTSILSIYASGDSTTTSTTSSSTSSTSSSSSSTSSTSTSSTSHSTSSSSSSTSSTSSSSSTSHTTTSSSSTSTSNTGTTSTSSSSTSSTSSSSTSHSTSSSSSSTSSTSSSTSSTSHSSSSSSSSSTIFLYVKPRLSKIDDPVQINFAK